MVFRKTQQNRGLSKGKKIPIKKVYDSYKILNEILLAQNLIYSILKVTIIYKIKTKNN